MLRADADTVDELKVMTLSERAMAAAMRTVHAALRVRVP
jgi:hypothetical protein